ncbi:MAG TPA: hypothetical protein VLN46_03240 [Gillisia sp.]|nr:hypothetical protein [Gillisia sp.]
MRIRNLKLIAGVLLMGILTTACNQTGKEQKQTSEVTTAQSHEVNYQVGDHVPNELVCMVNNAFMGESQMEVPVDGKMYYGCCEMCVGRLNEDETSRMATDPSSGNEVDKAEAYIVISDEHGKVEYFESRESFESYSGM